MHIHVFKIHILTRYSQHLSGPPLLQSSQRPVVEIRHNLEGIYLQDVTEISVSSVSELISAVERGQKNRSTSATQCNQHSSRSHSIISLNIVTGIMNHGKSKSSTIKSQFTLVDLAGSERQAKTGARVHSDQMKEAQNINKSLSALGEVMQALSRKDSHVPFRNSKLTHVLQPRLESGKHNKVYLNILISEYFLNI